MAGNPSVLVHEGETVATETHGVTFLCPYQGPLQGSLFVTNLKVAFRGSDGREVDVYLGLIERIDKFGGASNKADHSYGLELHCRDIRSLRFAFRTEGHTRRDT